MRAAIRTVDGYLDAATGEPVPIGLMLLPGPATDRFFQLLVDLVDDQRREDALNTAAGPADR